jgi:hypothetical protein
LYNRCVFKSAIVLIFLAIAASLPVSKVAAWQQQPGPQQPEEQPKVKVNVLNVCTPSKDEQSVLQSALSKVSGNPAFADDFEISRGRATLTEAPNSRYVRLRRDFASQSPLLTAQYSMSSDEKATIETLVLRMRDPKDFLEVSIEDRVSTGAASPLGVLATDTPAARIRVERMGKSSVVLARCEAGDQSAYEPLFKQASELAARYRDALGLRTAFRSDISWLGGPPKTGPGSGSRKQR